MITSAEALFEYFPPAFLRGMKTSRFACTALVTALATFAQAPSVSNLSSRAHVGIGGDIMFTGFNVGPGTNKTILIRATGPALTAFGVTGVLADPKLELYSGANKISENDNWSAPVGGATPITAATFSSVGAFGLTAGSRDAALLATLAPGSYTAQVSGVNNTTGVALIEVYEVGAVGGRLSNISTRARVGTDANIVIPGLVISPGSGTRRLLVRAAGPSLAPLGVTGFLTDPTMLVTNATTGAVVASNDNWGTPVGTGASNATALSTAFAQNGAFTFAPGSRDAALIAEFAPGSYTIQVSGVNSTSGVALVEVYEITPAGPATVPLRETVPGLRIESLAYPEHAATEWQVRLRGPDTGESPLYENLKSADFEVAFPVDAKVMLHWSKGSNSEPNDFEPKIEPLVAGKAFVLESFGGRSSDGAMPYFNLAGEGGGLIVAVGWTGDWRASFEQQDNGSVRVIAGLKRTRFRLAPGEEVRLPSILVMNYSGDWIAGQNQFRRLMLAHHTPTNHPPMTLMPVQAGVHGIFPFNETSEEKLVKLAADVAALNLPLDCYHLDAGWNEGGFPRGQGNPQADPARFPNGLAPVGAAVRRTGMRFLAWFEPERAMRGTWLEREHPDWLLKPTNTPVSLRYQERDGFLLLDLGNPRARQWATEAVSEEITRSGLSFYRQDFNLYPAYFWHTAEKPDEIGLREIRHINGLYDFLDELARRHPSLILDNCASGGRRLDFEMMRRCIVLWRSDSTWGDKSFPQNVQAMTHGLSHWLPLHGLGAAATDDLALRSGMGAFGGFHINYRDPRAVAALRKHLESYLKIRPSYTGEYHPLTPHTLDTSQWIAWQFHRADLGDGVVQAFRRPDAASDTLTVKLQGLDPQQRYEIENLDGGKEVHIGAELMRGYAIRLREKPAAAVLVLKAIQ
ncbi:MAG: hypothetical protein EXS39_06500 [Opitutaceae bacterium]|nr:hypothetical protein [Opitutaceae bacterium]